MDSIAGGTLHTHLFRTCAALAVLTLGSLNLYAQVTVLRIDPAQTDAAIATVYGPHIALYDPQAAPVHRLFLFLVGTNGRAEGSLTIDSTFAKWGYHAISLDYEDKVVTVTCAHSQDVSCFDHYRDTIVTGAPGSDKITVDAANSILNRLQKLLAYLVKHDPKGGWGEFVGDDGQPVWSRIVVAGHSQGSGHAAYLGKMFAVDRVLMFSGPQDYLDDLDKPAPWESRTSATPPSRYFAFLNENDPFNVHHQIANCMVLMDLTKPETQLVEPGEAVTGDSHILVNYITRNPHGSTLFPEFATVWWYMATASVQ